MRRYNKKSLIYKNLFRLIRLGTRFLFGKKDRFALSVRLTDRCQLSCIYCRKQEKIRDIDFDELTTFLTYYRKRGLFYIILTGGEPYLYPRFKELLDFLKDNDFYIVMNTNGQAIENPEYRKALNRMDEVVVSLDGPEKENDRNRGKGSYKKIIKAIRYLYSHNKKIVLSTVITKNNLNDRMLSFFLRLKKRFDVILDFGIVSPYMFGSIRDGMLSEEDEQRRFIKRLINIKKKYKISELSQKIMEYQMNPYEIRCVTPKYTLYIDVDGRVYPCVYGIGRDDMLLGDIREPENIKGDDLICPTCYCQSLLALNLLSENKFDIRSLFRWLG